MNGLQRAVKGRRVVKMNEVAQAQLIRLLLEGTLTCEELAVHTGLHYVTVLRYCRALWLAGAAYIDRYDADARGRHTIKVYRLGADTPDAKRPKYTQAERQARCRKGKRAIATQQAMTLWPGIAV